MRVVKNFFVQMAKELKINKNNMQCRSHHQKMMKKYSSVKKIIENILKEEIPYDSQESYMAYERQGLESQ